MPKTNRNEPCPCGSGKKYKKCCLAAADDDDFRYRRWQRVEAELIPKLLDFAFNAIGPEFISDGWNAFFDDEIDDEFEPDDPMNTVFMPWCLFSWRLEFNRLGSAEYVESTLAELFLKDNADSLTPDEKTLLHNYIGRPYSLCEIVEIKPGVGMTQFDLLRRVKYEVTERTASETLKRGEIIYCATADLDGIKFNIGTSPYALRPIEKHEVQKFRKWILEESKSEEITEDELDEFGDDIRGFYLDALNVMFTPPSLSTTDGDPWVPHKVHFELKSADNAFHQLKDLAEGAAESDLLADAVVKGGRVTRVDIPWSGGTDEARTRLGGAILLGLLKIDGQRLVVEVNSVARAELVRKLIEERCHGNATYKSTLIEPIESAVQEMWDAAAAGQSARAPSSKDQSSRGAAVQFKTSFSSDDSESFGAEIYDSSEETESSSEVDWTEEDNDAEIRAAMQALMKKHWETWLDLPVPALNDLTPREAAKTDEGRELLESLLLDFESRRHGTDDYSDPDIGELRRNLGME